MPWWGCNNILKFEFQKKSNYFLSEFTKPFVPLNPLIGKKKSVITNLIFIKYIEDKWSKLGGIPKRKELLINLLETCSVQLATRTIFDEAFVPGLNKAEIEMIKQYSDNLN